MASRTVLVDDLDGVDADMTVRFTFDGVGYEVDLGVAHYEEFRGALGPYIAAARKISGNGHKPRRPRTTAGKPDPAAVRDWARRSNIQIGPRGKIPADVLRAYETAVK